MAPNPSQPKKEIKENVAQLARVNRLRPFDDLRLVDQFAERYSIHPDKVFQRTKFSTLMAFHVKWKEEAEYQERFTFIYNELSSPTTTTPKNR